MKQIYNFERNTPPVLNEKMLRKELDNRRLRLQTTLASAGGLLLLLCMLLLSIRLYRFMPLLSAACAGYVCVAAVGSCVIALVFTRKRRSLIK